MPREQRSFSSIYGRKHEIETSFRNLKRADKHAAELLVVKLQAIVREPDRSTKHE